MENTLDRNKLKEMSIRNEFINSYEKILLSQYHNKFSDTIKLIENMKNLLYKEIIKFKITYNNGFRDEIYSEILNYSQKTKYELDNHVGSILIEAIDKDITFYDTICFQINYGEDKKFIFIPGGNESIIHKDFVINYYQNFIGIYPEYGTHINYINYIELCELKK